MIYKKFLFFLIYYFIFNYNIIFAMSEVLQLGVQLFSSAVGKAAEVRMRTEGYKEELINTQKAITKLIEKEKAKIKNLAIISEIKNDLIKQIEINNNENQLVIDSLYKLINTVYKNFIALSREFKEKYNKLAPGEKERSKVLLQIGLFSIKEALYGYLSFLKQYNYQLQNVSQKIQSKGQFNSLYVQMPEDKKFIDPVFDSDDLIANFDLLLAGVDGQSDTLLRSRDLLVNNNLVFFNSISGEILTIINNAAQRESSKDVNNLEEVFYDLSESLSNFKDKLFRALVDFADSRSEAKSILYKLKALLDINYNKIKNIINYMNNTIEDKNYTLNNFIKDLYNNLLENKKIIVASKDSYFESVSKTNIGFNKLAEVLRNFYLFMEKNTQNLGYVLLNEFLNRAKSVIANYKNAVLVKNKEIEDAILFLSYLDSFSINLKANIAKFQLGLENKLSQQKILQFNISPENNIFDKKYSKKKRIVNQHKGNSNELNKGVDNRSSSKINKKVNFKKNSGSMRSSKGKQ